MAQPASISGSVWNVKNPMLALVAPFALMAPAMSGDATQATHDTPLAAWHTRAKDTSGDDNSSDNSGHGSGDAAKKDDPPKSDPPKNDPPKNDPPKQDDNPNGADDQAPAGAAPDAPAPAAGRAVVVGPTSGAVRVRLPGSDTFVDLGDGRAVPVGAIVDATHGKVSLTSTSGSGVQTGKFWGATFQIRQRTAANATTDLVLRGGDFTRCPTAKHRPGVKASAARRTPRVIRTLWGTDHGGRFRTQGRSSVATVRGTAWVTQDRCDGTLTRVTSGAVSVWDRATKRRVLVRAGRQHLARHPRRR